MAKTARRRSARSAAEPTKQQLYEKARRLGIEGRSKMSKRQLESAVSRRSGSTSSRSGRRGSSVSTSSSRVNPIEVQRFLEGAGYPTERESLVEHARRQGAGRDIESALERLPRRRFESPSEVSEAVGQLR